MRQREYDLFTPRWRRIRRIELEGREGWPPPMRIYWEDATTFEFLGHYECDESFHVKCFGPMFERAA